MPLSYSGAKCRKFLSTPSARRATMLELYHVWCQQFLSTPSARRATYKDSSIHTYLNDFYPRPPRGGRPADRPFDAADRDFYPRPPRGGRLQEQRQPHRPRRISIHALREEGDHCFHCIKDWLKEISIHALREEGDETYPTGGCAVYISIHALREEGDNVHEQVTSSHTGISIHALREEGDAVHPAPQL